MSSIMISKDFQIRGLKDGVYLMDKGDYVNHRLSIKDFNIVPVLNMMDDINIAKCRVKKINTTLQKKISLQFLKKNNNLVEVYLVVNGNVFKL